MDLQESLTWHQWDREAAQAFEAVAAVEPASGGMCSVSQLLHGCHLGRIGESSIVAVRPFRHAAGVEWQVAAGVSLIPGAAFVGFPAVDAAAKAAGVAVVSFETPHKTLAKFAQRRGYVLAGYVLRKAIGAH